MSLSQDCRYFRTRLKWAGRNAREQLSVVFSPDQRTNAQLQKLTPCFMSLTGVAQQGPPGPAKQKRAGALTAAFAFGIVWSPVNVSWPRPIHSPGGAVLLPIVC
jgi:hypothetical protein